MRRPKVEHNIDRKKFANDLRSLADDIDADKVAVVAAVYCDVENNGSPFCFMRPDLSGDVYELIDEMIDGLREALKATYESES